jgi:hypothetical protein
MTHESKLMRRDQNCDKGTFDRNISELDLKAKWH